MSFVLFNALVKERIKQTIKKSTMAFSVAGLLIAGAPHHAHAVEPTQLTLTKDNLTASHGANQLELTVDSNASTRWTTGKQQSNGMFFQIDLKKVMPVDRIQMVTEHARASTNDHPRLFDVWVSNDGVSWSRLSANNIGNDFGTTEIFLNKHNTRHIKIVQTGSVQKWWWSIHDLKVFGTEVLANNDKDTSTSNPKPNQPVTPDFDAAIASVPWCDASLDETNAPSCNGADNPFIPPTQCGLKASGEGSKISEYFDRFSMPVVRNGCKALHRPHSMRAYSINYTGRCGGCKAPNRIHSAAFDNTVIVSWAASANHGSPSDKDSKETRKRRYGHLSTFTFTESEGFKKVSDFAFDECNFDMGAVTVSADGSVIGAICLANKPDGNPQKTGYLYEWTGGKITQNPHKKSVLSTSLGGDALQHGHWDLSLNKDASSYYVSVATISKDGAHQFVHQYSLNRTTDVQSKGGGCGAHPTANRIVHNDHYDNWSVFCREGTSNLQWTFADENSSSKFTLLGHWSPSSFTDTPGGVHNAISLGQKGWLLAATGPFDLYSGSPNVNESKKRLLSQQIGIRHLPNAPSTFTDALSKNANSYPWKWIPLKNVCQPTQTSEEKRVGMVQIHNWGEGGENSGRTLLAYSPSRGHTTANEYHAVEINENGDFLHEPVLLQKGGWGIDSLGTHIPGSGCVVFPFTSSLDYPEKGIQGGYPRNYDSIANRSGFIKMTALCPVQCDANGSCKPAQYKNAVCSAPK